MSHACENIHDFVFGELDDGAADSFREHLGGCETCPEELHELLQLAALEASAVDGDVPLEDDGDSVPFVGDSVPFVGDESPKRDGKRFEETDLPIKPIEKDVPFGDELALRRWRKTVTVAAVVFAAAAAIGLVVWQKRSKPAASEAVIASAKNRPLEMRLSHRGAFAHRPYDVMRAGELPVEHVPIKVMAVLDERGDQLGVATAHLLGRDPKKAEPLLAKLDETANVLSDRGVAAFLRGDKREALRLIDRATKLDPGFAPALFNKALLYADLGLPLGAAKLFDQVAAQQEPGWSKEAARRARELREPAEKGVKSYRETQDLGIAAIGAGDVLPLEAVKRYPGLGRLLLYDAIRGAPSKAFLERLLPHVETIDVHYGTDDMARMLERSRNSNWSTRPTIAERYRKIRAGAKTSAGDLDRLLKETIATDSPDIAIGLYVLGSPNFRVGKDHLADFAALIAPLKDPWLDLLAVQQRGQWLIDDGQPLETIALLQPALERCNNARLHFRCGYLANSLAYAWLNTSNVDRASDMTRSALSHFRAAGIENGLSTTLLLLAQLEAGRDVAGQSSAVMANAFLEEVLLRESSQCIWEVFVYAIKSNLAVNRRDLDLAEKLFKKFEAARRTCEVPLSGEDARIRAEFFAHRNPDQSLEEFLALLDSAEATATDASEKTQFKFARARALARKDPSAAKSTLIEFLVAKIGTAGSLESVLRAHAFLALNYAAAEKGDFDEVLRLTAKELNHSPPQHCAVAIFWANDRVTAVRGKDGETIGSFEEAASPLAVPLPAPLQDHLDGCAEVTVYARSPYFGSSKLLDTKRAWHFATPNNHPANDSPDLASTKLVRVVVADVAAPASLDLAPLRPWKGDASIRLLGEHATRASVLGALPAADEIEFHVHGLLGVSGDDAFLVLSPDQSGAYALRTRDIQKLTLPKAPTVFLGACHAGQGASTFDQPYSLVTAFVEAGAKTVFASQQPIADSTAGPFFKDIRDKLSSGKSPAAALRDTRLEWQAENPWVNQVVVFN